MTHVDDVGGTVEVALTLQPDTTEVVVAAGSSESDQYRLRHDRQVFDRLAGRVHFRYLSDLPMLALLRELSHLKPHTIVFIHALSRDSAGQDFDGSEVVNLIARNANMPVYGLASSVTAEGLVGGRPSGRQDRRFSMALEIVRRILDGEKVSQIPVQQAKPPYT